MDPSLFYPSPMSLSARSCAAAPARFFHARIFILIGATVLGLMISPRPAAAQTACAPSESTRPLQSVLPLELLDYLEQNAASPFVEAFLVGQLNAAGNREHWLGVCARRFIDTPLDSIAVVRSRRLPVDQVLAAFRDAERQRQAEERIRGGSLTTVVSGLVAARDVPSLAGALPFLKAAQLQCAATSPLCTRLKAASALIERAIAQRDTLRVAEGERDEAEKQRNALASPPDSAYLRQLTDSLQSLRTRIGEIAARPDSAVAPSIVPDTTEIKARIEAEAAVLQAAGLRRDSHAVRLREAVLTMQRARTRADSLAMAIGTALAELGEALAHPSATPVLSAQLVVPTSAIQVNAVIASPGALALTSPEQNKRAASVLLELTDFVIARAKQELVLGFLAGMYRLGTRTDGTAVATAFPSTFKLMRSLSTSADTTRLSAVAAGQVPLSVWRATLADDYVHLPTTLVGHLCGAGRPCHSRVQPVQPALRVVQQVVAGDGVLDILRALPARLRLTAASTTTDTTLQYGLRLLATLSEAFRVQGIAAAADPLRHPYILTARSLVQSRPAQQQAFVRLLLASAVPEDVQVLPHRPDSLLLGIETAARSLEALISPVGEGDAASAARVIRNATDAFIATFDLARGLAPAGDHQAFNALREQWRTVFALLPPLAERDYPLFMARTTALVRDLSGSSPSVGVLQIMGLAANLSSARSSADVRAAFEAAAAPAGLWQEKRYGHGGRTTVTAFPGIAVGREEIDGVGGLTVGGSAQIGFEYQFGSRASSGTDRGCDLGVCSAGLFVPIVDLGTLVTYRVSGNDSTDVHPNESIRQVFAPGLYLTFGLGRSPLALLAGVQFVPGIRNAADGTGTRNEADAWRVGAGLTFDVTLFRF